MLSAKFEKVVRGALRGSGIALTDLEQSLKVADVYLCGDVTGIECLRARLFGELLRSPDLTKYPARVREINPGSRAVVSTVAEIWPPDRARNYIRAATARGLLLP